MFGVHGKHRISIYLDILGIQLTKYMSFNLKMKTLYFL